MQIKSTLKFHFIPDWPSSRKQTISEDEKKKKPSYTVGGHVN
jgi:hypothetical protein